MSRSGTRGGWIWDRHLARVDVLAKALQRGVRRGRRERVKRRRERKRERKKERGRNREKQIQTLFEEQNKQREETGGLNWVLGCIVNDPLAFPLTSMSQWRASSLLGNKYWGSALLWTQKC